MNAEHFPFNYTRRNGWGCVVGGEEDCQPAATGKHCASKAITLHGGGLGVSLRFRVWGKRLKLWVMIRSTPVPSAFQPES